ncbi:MAG: glycosyltransferase [Ilumatobacter sp.]|nr:glycosyltransferase [Ilumatobacter sp.]
MRTRRQDTFVSVGLDWVHPTLAIAEHHVFGTGARFVNMCYDLIPIDHPEWLFPPDVDGFRRYLSRSLRVASATLCISRCTQSDLLRHFPDLDPSRAPVVTLGADAAIETGAAQTSFASSVFGGEPYAIYCATVDRRKNHQVLYRAMRELVHRGAAGNLLFVGRVGSGTADLIDALRNDRAIAGRVALVTDCDDRHLAALYEKSVGAVYPSLYEGWGLGVTEALAHGRPCVVASGSSLGEAGLGVCPEVHPLRTGEWADALERLFGGTIDPPDAALPTWDSAATRLLEVTAP